ncbi:GT2 family glycosyltransferase [Chitinophaga niastensis]|uniref:GT2 family glycosyltransferase n=1 Tax=Chitinophaga niastensis TaxID=536980 RepID=A0A2P8HDA3_CHINA|nr:glycosyltransferase [Chitinophaga niastensis]PSL44215.1 GT2 family glycosyltransferase [Chitinophaga niastensis]
MAKQVSIDVVIPSFRLEEKYLLPILQLKRPESAIIRFYLVADNPALVPAEAIKSLVDNEHVFLTVNSRNLGAALTRNKGIEMGQGDWILFLDDDIVCNADLLETYVHAIEQYPEEIGFIGLVNLPKPGKSFSHAILANGSMDTFTLAAKYDSAAWGATANLMISRKAVGDVRFSERYPKFGGGEDVDFFINIRERNGYRNYKTLPAAAVAHPWWDNENANFKRFFRYGVGNSFLPQLNPKYAYRDLLDGPETLFMAVLATIVLSVINIHWLAPMLTLIGGILLIEIIAIIVQALKRKVKPSLATFRYMVQLRFVYESGILWGNLTRFRLAGISQRFNFDGSFPKKGKIFETNTYKTIKWILYPVLVFFIVKRFM